MVPLLYSQQVTQTQSGSAPVLGGTSTFKLSNQKDAHDVPQEGCGGSLWSGVASNQGREWAR